jgi:hypothetical protein
MRHKAAILSLGVGLFMVGPWSCGGDDARISSSTDTITQGLDCQDGVDVGPDVLMANPGAVDAGTAWPQVLWHCGAVMGPTKAQLMYWGPSWQDPSFAIDRVDGLQTFFTGFGDSRYAQLASEYTGITQGAVIPASSAVSYLPPAYVQDAFPQSGSVKPIDAVDEVCGWTNNSPDPSTLYILLSELAQDGPECGWHASGKCSNGSPLLVIYVPNLDASSPSCGGITNWNADPTRSVPLAKLANTLAHELTEARTDPFQSGWFDVDGGEVGDKCAWTFQSPVTLTNGSRWDLQTEWSNQAYAQGLDPCVQGD